MQGVAVFLYVPRCITTASTWNIKQQRLPQEKEKYQISTLALNQRNPSYVLLGLHLKKKLQSNKMVSQSEVEDSLVSLLVEDMQPLSTVECSGLKKFCSRVLPHYELPSRRTARCRLHSVYDRKKTKWIAKLQQVKWISDTWSAHKSK